MKLASVEKIIEIYPHPDADRVEFVRVLGFTCIVPIGKYKIDELVILIQPDTVLPDTEWAEPYKKRSKRVKALRFRGLWSFGIVESTDILPEGCPFAEGTEISSTLGVIKYEAPVPQQLDAKGRLPFGMGKTDETNYQNIDIHRLFGKAVDVSLKVDGQSCTFYYKDGQFGVTGRRLELKLDVVNNYTDHIERYNIKQKLTSFCEENKVNLAIRGESYGTGIQSHKANPHSKKNRGFIMFSVFNLDTLEYERKGSPLYFPIVAEALGIPSVPILEEDVPLTLELLEHYSSGIKRLPNGDKFEGVVINHSKGSFKVINLNYDSTK